MRTPLFSFFLGLVFITFQAFPSFAALNRAEVFVFDDLNPSGSLFKSFSSSKSRTPLRASSLGYSELLVKQKGAAKLKKVRVHSSELTSKLREFRNRKNIEYVEPNYTIHSLFAPNDLHYKLQWHLNSVTSTHIQAESAWDIAQGTGTVVAVIDTGIAYERFGAYFRAPDFAQTCFVPGYDFVNDDGHPNDDNSHGTHIAGTIAQSTHNAVGVAGVAFRACLMPVKVLNADGVGTVFDVANGIRFAADNGARVINLSLGGDEPSLTLEEALKYAHDKGVTIVAAAGNSGTSTVSYPARYNDYVIAVGATRFDGQLASYSSFGADLDLVAPGGDLAQDQNGDGFGDGVLQNTFNPTTRVFSDFAYWFRQGTSMAAAHAAGVAALIISHKGNQTPLSVRQSLQSTARDLGVSGFDERYGFGLVDARAALQFGNQLPTAKITGLSSALMGRSITFSGASSTDSDGFITKYTWDFGDGTPVAYGRKVSHAFATSGAYTVRLTVRDSSFQTATDTTLITIAAPNMPPVAFAGPDRFGTATVPLIFSGASSTDSDGFITKYTWDFGDGTPVAYGRKVSHAFATSGAYTVKLIVRDDDFATSSDSAVITIN